MARVYASFQRILSAHDPYPGLVIDSRWDVVLANRAASALMALVQPAALFPTPNVFRILGVFMHALREAAANESDDSARRTPTLIAVVSELARRSDM